jgi:hypothetical protein
MSASDRPRPKGPSPTWLVPVVLGTIAALLLSQWVDLPAFVEKGLAVFEVLVHGFFILAVVVALRGWAGVPGWLRLRGISKRYPYEPWRWEFPQGRELVDEQVSKFAETVKDIVVAVIVLLVMTALLIWILLGGVPMPGGLIFAVFIGAMEWLLIRKGLLPAITRVLAFARYGQTRLRLQRFPLVPGTKTAVELIIPRGLSNLRQVRAALRRVREIRRESTVKPFIDTQLKQLQRVDAQEAGSGDTLTFVLEVPPAEPEESTDLNSAYKCFWELQLTSDVPGLDLDVTFKLPVYWVDEGQSSAA